MIRVGKPSIATTCAYCLQGNKARYVFSPQHRQVDLSALSDSGVSFCVLSSPVSPTQGHANWVLFTGADRAEPGAGTACRMGLLGERADGCTVPVPTRPPLA